MRSCKCSIMKKKTISINITTCVRHPPPVKYFICWRSEYVGTAFSHQLARYISVTDVSLLSVPGWWKSPRSTMRWVTSPSVKRRDSWSVSLPKPHPRSTLSTEELHELPSILSIWTSNMNFSFINNWFSIFDLTYSCSWWLMNYVLWRPPCVSISAGLALPEMDCM